MPMDVWPCVPDSISEVLSDETIELLVAGASEMLGRPIMLAETRNGEVRTWDPPRRYDWYRPFCRCLRADGISDDDRAAMRGPALPQCRVCGGDDACTRFDRDIILKLSQQLSPGADQPYVYPCYMGLLEVAQMLEVGGHRFIAISGQFGPADEALPDVPRSSTDTVSALLDRLEEGGILRLGAGLDAAPEGLTALFNEYARDIKRPATTAALRAALAGLEPLTRDVMDRFHRQVKTLEGIVQEHHKRRKAALEDKLVQRVELAYSPGSDAEPRQALRLATSAALKTIREAMNAERAALFAVSGRLVPGKSASILSLCGSSGYTRGAYLQPPHFNWRKSGLPPGEALRALTPPQMAYAGAEATKIGSEGLRGPNAALYQPVSACLARHESEHHSAVLTICGLPPTVPADEVRGFLKRLCDRLIGPYFTISEGLASDELRRDWESTSKVTGHRVRASLQGIASVLKTLRDADEGKPWVRPADRASAVTDLEERVQRIRDVSSRAELAGPDALEPSVTTREVIPLSEIIWEAISDFEDFARASSIEIVTSDLDNLPMVSADRTLLRVAIGNIIDNAIKYSRNPQEGGERIVKIRNVSLRDGRPSIEVENMGLGVPPDKLQAIFERGVRLNPTGVLHQARAGEGQGIGLWEARRILEGHGGGVDAASRPVSGGQMTTQNMGHCITILRLWVAKWEPPREGT